jgi:hypothetical protein
MGLKQYWASGFDTLRCTASIQQRSGGEDIKITDRLHLYTYITETNAMSVVW